MALVQIPLSAHEHDEERDQQFTAGAWGMGWIYYRTVNFPLHAIEGLRGELVSWLIGELEAGRPVSIVDDQVGSPTFADNLASMLLALLFSDRRGFYNTVGADILDRCTFARLAASIFGLDVALVRPITTAQLGAQAPRPLRSGLVMDKFKSHFPDVPVLSMKEALGLLRRQMGGD